ncbi:hypothetical protein SDC9_165338 [bioreactor metagenome]|uniref:Uncharacterized protein n=1 Tax=bioreactor metagenome TaxID=1076179 RepID=A0A645FWC6_9ZZZZ
MAVAEALTETDGATEVLIVIATGLELAVAGLAHASDEVIKHITTSPLFREELE